MSFFSLKARSFVPCVLVYVFCSLMGLACTSLAATEKAPSVFLDWENVPALIRTAYAPLEWKKKHFGWDLDLAVAEAQSKLFVGGPPQVALYRQTLRHFLASLHDYHVGPRFISTEQATLPFSIMGAEGKYWICWINRDHLPERVFPFEVGDELVLFDGKPTEECIQEILTDCYAGGKSLTEWRLAQRSLTRRLGSRGDDVPQGSISIHVASAKTGKVSEHQIVWDYEKNVLPSLHVKNKRVGSSVKGKTLPVLDVSMVMTDAADFCFRGSLESEMDDPGAIGEVNSFFPPLADPEYYEEGSFPFYAYTFEHPKTGKTIGYVRIPHYDEGDEEEVEAFGELIEYFEQTTSALVIDQTNNPGGSVCYLSALLSLLSPEPLNTPHHQMAITYDDAVEAYAAGRYLKQIDSDEDLQRILHAGGIGSAHGYPLTYQNLLMLRNHCDLIVKTWQKGETVTPPTHLGGIDRIFPHPDYLSYSKPILVLINGLDFSGGDFFPAILQDTLYKGKPRAVLFGERTAGAGGAVGRYAFPNQYGVGFISYTTSIACRHGFLPDKGRIENLGVTPDIPYTFTRYDIQNKWKGYRQAILDALVPMTETVGTKK